MALEYTTTSQVSRARGVKMLVYGRSGVGKTMLAATCPKPLVISAEAGLLSLSPENQVRVFGTHRDLDVVEISTLDQLIEVHEQLERYPGTFETAFLDSATEIGEKVLANALAQVKDPRQAYGELLEKMHNTLKAFRDLANYHVVFVAKEEARNKNDRTLFGPAMPGSKLGPQVPYIFDEVFHLDVHKAADGTLYRALQTQPDVEFDAKDRSGALEIIEEPHLQKIINKIIPTIHEQ